MEYRRLGKSGLKVSALSFGSWVTFSNQLDDRAAHELAGTIQSRLVSAAGGDCVHHMKRFESGL